MWVRTRNEYKPYRFESKESKGGSRTAHIQSPISPTPLPPEPILRNNGRVKMIRLTGPANLQLWDSWAKAQPAHALWQSIEWKNYQDALGREARMYCAMEGEKILAGALVVIDRTSFGLSAWDIPRGPLWTDAAAAIKLIEAIHSEAKKDKCLNLYLSPIQALPHPPRGSKQSFRSEQPEATRIVDLTLSDDEILAGMHQKGRYNIKVAQKNGIRIEESTNIDAYAELAHQTAIRDRYKAAPKSQYESFLHDLSGSFLLLAYTPDQPSPIAGLLGVIWNNTGIYYYGASDYAHRALMAPYLLQWEAIQRCRQAGCTQYDLLGVAPPGADADHPWKGITSFKEKFGGELITYPPERRISFRPVRRGLLSAKRKMFG